MTDYTTQEFFIKPSKRGLQDFEYLLAQDYQIHINDWLKNGWELFKKDATSFIAFAVVAGILYLMAGVIPLTMGLGATIIALPLIAGLIIVSLMLLTNQTTGFKNYFWGFRHLVPLLLFTIVSTVFILIGTVLLLLPGIYLTVAYLFSPYLIVDKNLDFWPAMELSRRRVNKHWFGVFAFCIVILFLNLLGCIPLFLGLFITIPVSVCALTAAYTDIFGTSEVTGEAR